jgi:hypothetical protein
MRRDQMKRRSVAEVCVGQAERVRDTKRSRVWRSNARGRGGQAADLLRERSRVCRYLLVVGDLPAATSMASAS